MANQYQPDLSRDAQRVLHELPPDGSPAGNIRLRAILHMPRTRYDNAKEELVAKHTVFRGIGRGGTLARTTPVSGEELEHERGVAREDELYERFATWLRTEQFAPDADTPFSHVAITATPKGRIRPSGPWSRPDVTAVQVIHYEFLPEITVEVSAFEIKRANAASLSGVCEAAAHARAAHFASLVVEVTDEMPHVRDYVLDECARHHVGLYEMRGSQVDPRREPERRNPPPSEVDTRLRVFFATLSPEDKERFRRAIEPRLTVQSAGL